MKTVILGKITQVSVGNIDPQKYYGVLSCFIDKGFITQEQYCKGSFRVLAASDVTEGNHFCSFKESSDLTEFVKGIIERGEQVFEFDSCKELFAWLAE